MQTALEHFSIRAQAIWLSSTAVVLLFSCCNSSGAQEPAPAEANSVNQKTIQSQDPIDYLRDIAPIFDQHCSACHGANKQTSDLRLDRRSAILKGSGSGKVVEAGNSSKSRLIEVVSGQDPDYLMPPEGDRLTEVQINSLRRWIDSGALGPDDSKDLDRQLPWSFSPLSVPAIEPQQLQSLSESLTNPIDYFLISQLKENSLEFSPPAEKRTLIRRLYLTVLGIQPAISDIEDFLADRSHLAYERLVERVLADARFGERMARHWFDVIRFAESNGFETNRVRYNAWPYRDYVIQSFNRDTPYNQFVAEQLVGDVLGVDVATGYLVAGTYDLVKSPDVNLTLMQRQDELADLINTTGTTFLGLTLGCARCHDHKFDPITQADFYSLQAVLAGVNFGERALPPDMTPQTAQRMKQLQSEITKLNLLQQETLTKASLAIAQRDPNANRKLRDPVNSKLNTEEFEPIRASAVRFTVKTSGNTQPCVDEWEVFNVDGQNVASSQHGGKASASSLLPGYAIHQVAHLNDGKLGNDNSWISNEVNAGVAEISFAQPEVIKLMQWGRDRNEKFRDRLPTDYSIEALCEGKWQIVASSDDRKDASQTDQQYLISQLDSSDQAKFAQFETTKLSLTSELKKITGDQQAWLGTFSQPAEVHRLYRGDPLMKREVAPPSMITSLGGKPMGPNTPEQARRKALAEFIADSKNPLTARVIVNRMWQYTFGTGIVDTPSDFGGNGSSPSHPDLLDWLARDFIEHDWSIKHLQRQMLLTQAFRQSSKPTKQGIERDASSRLLWRYPPRRLEAEAIRDSMLVASGVVDWRMGGPGFFLQRVEQDNVYRYFPKEEFGPDEFRRMVYLTRVRGEQDTVFGSLDCPNGNQVVPKRSRSNTPLQALNLFNSTFVQQQAELLAERLQREGSQNRSDSPVTITGKRVELAFELLVARKPDQFELHTANDLISKQGMVAFCRAMLNATEFLFVF